MTRAKIDNLTLKQIRIFLTAAELENFSQTAERLYISQPMVSLSIAQLERDVGHPLFDRNKKQVRLNKAGRVLRDKLRDITKLIDSAVESSREAWASDHTSFTVCLPMLADVEKYFFPVLGQMNEAYPGLRTRMNQMEIGSAINSVLAGTVDLAFSVLPETIQFRDLPIQWTMIRPCRTFLEVPQSSRLYERESLTLKDLADEPIACVMLDGVSGYTEAVMGLFTKEGLSPTGLFQVSNTASLEISSAQGEGSVFRVGINIQHNRSGNRWIPVENAPNGIVAFWRQGSHNPFVPAFIDLIKTHLEAVSLE